MSQPSFGLVPGEPQVIRSVEQLHGALRIAAELEHGLCCQYLFAAFTLKRFPADLGKAPADLDPAEARLLAATQQWAGTIMHIARQEMEHLAIVLNLQAATGAPPHLSRPNFPVAAGTYPIPAHFCLERLDETSLERFVFYEKADDVDFPFDDPGCCRDAQLTAERGGGLRSHAGLEFHSIQQLYQEILNAFYKLPAGDLFPGDPARQVTSTAVQWSFGVSVPAIYTREEAKNAINQIVMEGEGKPIEPELPPEASEGNALLTMPPVELHKLSHYRYFSLMLSAYRNRESLWGGIDPAMPVACNPWPGVRAGVTPVQNELTLRVMRFFDAGYRLMVAMIRDFFQEYRSYYGSFPPWEPDAKAAALFHAGFYPMMTLLVRPIGEMLCRLPVSDSLAVTAGPAFATDEDWATGADHDLDWYLYRLCRLEAKARSLREAEFPARGDEFRATFERLEHALHRLQINVVRLWQGRSDV